jgi:DNA-binding transcriptional LysR family regulator
MEAPMDKLDLFRTIVRVTDLASFTQAGDSLGLPKSTVSEHIRLLEERLGARLLHRTTRKVQPTQDGLALYERCKGMLDELDELEGLFRNSDELRGRLRVDLPTAIARRLVMPNLGGFLGQHPDLHIQLSSTDRRVDLIREGFDCVLRIGALDDDSLVARPLGSLQMVNCASPAYLTAHGTPRSLADLAGHKLVHYVQNLGSGHSSGFEYVVDGRTQFLPMPGNVTVNNADSYKAACLGGFGIIQVPLIGALEELERGELLEILPGHLPAPMNISLLYAHRRHLPQRVRVFMDWLSALVAAELQA